MPVVRRRPLAGLAAVGAVALIAGCGGGSDSLSADEFREQADAICADTNREIQTLTAPTDSTTDTVLPFLNQGLTIQQTRIDRLRELEPPADLEAAYNELLEVAEQHQARIQEATDQIAAGEEPEAVLGSANAEIEQLDAEADQKAEDLGLTICATDSGEEPSSTTGTTSTAPQTATTAPETGTTGAQTAEATQYVADVQEAAGALRSFGTTLQQNASNLSELQAQVPAARENLDQFDAAIATLAGYTLANARLEQQRAGLAETGPKVSDVLNRFLDAVADGDAAAVGALVPEVTQALNDFQSAATDVTP